MTPSFPEAAALPEAADSAASLSELEAQARASAAVIDQAFARAGDNLARSLARAASDGKISLRDLAAAVISAVDAAAGIRPSGGPGGGAGGGLGDLLAAVLHQAGGFAGARANGGPVTPGGAYLVGERGPEIFRPATSGVVETGVAPSVQVTVVVPGGAASLARSEAQVAQALARAVRLGVR